MMMRINKDNLPYHSIAWFGVDDMGKILAFFTLGDGNVPDFVLESEEETMELFHYWCGHPQWDFGQAFDFRRDKDTEALLERGLYLCVCDDPYDGSYKVAAAPDRPIHLSQLPESIASLLKNHRISLDITKWERVYIEE